MRLSCLIAIAAVSAALLTGCFTADDSRKPLAAHDRKCEQLGFKRGTPEYTNCRFEQAGQATPRASTPAMTD